ncbi:MAG: pilus assembly protein CpaF [Chloroflexota bacterium]|nr:pilus assembly protein CpaF [Chloroflexota bacterium]
MPAARPAVAPGALDDAAAAGPRPAEDELRARVRAHLSLHLDADITDPFSGARDRLGVIRRTVREALEANGRAADHATVQALMDDLVGLGPLQRHMDDETVSDILVNRWDEVYVERRGRLEPTATRFRDQAHLEQVIQKIVALVGREISVEKPMVDARMSDGSRANAVYAPVGGPTLCIRKFNHLKLDLAPSPAAPGPGEAPVGDWVTAGGMSLAMAEFLAAMASCRANVLISGATGAGKSTLLRSLVSAFPPQERVVTIEDTAELRLDTPHWVKLECVHSKSLGDHGSGERRLDVADLVQNALRMRPDRLIIGEIRHSKEAYYTLEALNTGHDGSATTIHASGCEDALARLELLVTRDFPSLPAREVRGYIARVFNIIVHVTRLRSGVRCVSDITELDGLDDAGAYRLRPVFQATFSDGATVRPTYAALPEYRPGTRLRRRLELEGMRWIG